MKPNLIPYLRAVGFNVVWARESKANIRSDRALVAFARRYNRILVCHDRHRDVKKETRILICQEIYEKGGQVIQVHGSPAQSELTSLGKILVHRHKWCEFFNSNHGIVTVSDASNIKCISREKLIHQVQGIFNHPTVPSITPKAPRRKRTSSKHTNTSPQQLPLEQGI